MSTVAPVLDQLSHRYALEGKPLVSVSRVIDSVMKKSFDGVDPEILRNAAERGMAVEKYATEWLATGGVAVPADERQDVIDRLECFERFMKLRRPKLLSAQQMVWNGEVAGMLDFILEIDRTEWLVDMKCTASPEASWVIQVGAYCELSRHTGPCAVLHINPKYAQGYIWREYDTETVKSQWRTAFAWFQCLQQLKVEAA